MTTPAQSERAFPARTVRTGRAAMMVAMAMVVAIATEEQEHHGALVRSC